MWFGGCLSYFISSPLTYTFRSTEMFSSFCWFCLVPSCLQGATHSFDDLQYQIQADAFIIAPKMCVGVVWWFVVLVIFFFLSVFLAILLILCISVSSLTTCAALHDHCPPPSSELSFVRANTVSNLVISVSLS